MVIDASAAVELLLGTRAGRRLLDRVEGGVPAHAPQLIDIEIG